MAGLVNFFSPWWKGVLGACSGPKWPTLAHLEHPEKVLSFKKEAERGWKSGARSLSWKSDWKPSISRSFCAIGTYCIFFRLEVTAVWKKKCRYKQISFTKSLLLLKGHFQSSFIFPFQCSITYVHSGYRYSIATSIIRNTREDISIYQKWYMYKICIWKIAQIYSSFPFQILLDVNREADDIRELERRGAEQLPVRERGAGALPRAVEQGRQGGNSHEVHSSLICRAFDGTTRRARSKPTLCVRFESVASRPRFSTKSDLVQCLCDCNYLLLCLPLVCYVRLC